MTVQAPERQGDDKGWDTNANRRSPSYKLTFQGPI